MIVHCIGEGRCAGISCLDWMPGTAPLHRSATLFLYWALLLDVSLLWDHATSSTSRKAYMHAGLLMGDGTAAR